VSDTLLYVFVAIVALIVVIVLFRTMGSKGAQTPAEEGEGVSDGLAAAVEDVVGEFTGVEAHPDTPGDTEVRRPADDGSGGQASIAGGGAGDELTQIKGLGPKAAEGLKAMGVTRFEQIAGWTAGDVETIGNRLGGTFAQRIARDRWVEQAGLLARGETAAFEEKFGKLGS
jgi:predicted flap endonuclease-1-like 5' DNA nuclease